MPNRLTIDSNANRRLDILRCPMEHSAHAYLFLARSPQEEVFVEILRGSVSLINFTIPWSTRRTGYLLSSPSDASRLDPWKNIESTPKIIADKGSSKFSFGMLEDVYLCSPGFEFKYQIKQNQDFKLSN